VENLVNVETGGPEEIGEVGSVRHHQRSIIDQDTAVRDRREPFASCELGDPLTMNQDHRRGMRHQKIKAFPRKNLECRLRRHFLKNGCIRPRE
jgi:hypothetical protein